MPWGKDKNDQQPPNPPNPPANEPPKTSELSADAILAKMGELLGPISTRLQAIEDKQKTPEPVREPSSLLDNPDGWANEKIGPVAVATVNANARITIGEIIGELREQGYGDLVSKIKEQCDNAPINIKAGAEFAQYCRNVANMVIGEEARKGGLKRKGSSFILEDAGGSNDPVVEAANEDDRNFLNYSVTTSKGKKVTRRELLERTGVLVEGKDANGKTVLVTSHDLSDPSVLKAAKESWSRMQVVN